MIDFDVDLVVPFVKNREKVWLNTYNEHCMKNKGKICTDSNSVRFDDIGFFKFMLMGVKKFMPFIRKVHLIVSNIEQVPPYIDKEKTNIVLHKDIIPKKFLPTFNSTTIEMFIHNIPDLSEHFIYSNDDMYPLNFLTKEDFFTEDGKIKMNYKNELILDSNNQFRKVCYNNQVYVCKNFNFPFKENEFIKPCHTMTPMIKSNVKMVREKNIFEIETNIDAFRTDKQHNQYIYPIYEILNNNCDDSSIKFMYVDSGYGKENIINEILNKNNQIICINDVLSEKRMEMILNKIEIVNAFNEKLR